MSDTDRGAYTPPTADAPLAFDARQPVRGSRPIPMTLIVSGVVLLILIAAIVFFYRSGVRQAGQAPQAVGTPVGQMTSPAPPGEQPKDPAAGLQIYQTENGKAAPAGAPTFTAPPEEPAPRAAPASQVAQAPMAPAKPASKAAELKPAQPAPAPTVAAPKVEAPKPAAPKPAAPKVEAPAPKPVAKAETPAPKPTAGAAGVAGVQIGAFSSKAQADEGWDAAARIAPGAIAGKGKSIVPVQVNGSTLYRTTVTGFASRADAKAFCDALKAAGKNCFVK